MSRPGIKPGRTLRGAENHKYYCQNEHEAKMIEGLKRIEDMMAKNNDAEAQLINMAQTGGEALASINSGCIFGCLTSSSKDTYHKFSKLLHQTGAIDPQITLTPVNFILIEMFWTMSEGARDNFFFLLNDMIHWRLNKIEIILGNVLREFLQYGDLPPRFEKLMNVLSIVKQHSDYLFTKSKEVGFVVATVVNCCVGYLIELKQCPPEFSNDARKKLVQMLEMIMTNHFDIFQGVFGRNAIMIMALLSRVPEVAAVWKQLVTSPGAISFFDVIRRPPERWVDSTMVPSGIQRKLEFLSHTPPDMCRPHFREMVKACVKTSTEGILKAFCLKAFLNPSTKPDLELATLENRAICCANLLASTNAENLVEFQTCKLAFFIEWFGYDSYPSNIALPLQVVTAGKAFLHLLQINPPVANSLYEYLIITVQQLYPPLMPMFVKSVTRVFQGFSKAFPVHSLLDSTKIDKSLREQFKELFPDLCGFFRKVNPPEITTVPISPVVEKAPQISVAAIIDPIEPPAQKEVPHRPKKKLKKRPVVPPPIVEDSVKPLPNDTTGWDASLCESIEKHFGPLSDDIKNELLKLESAINEGDDAVILVEDVFGAIVRNVNNLLVNEELKDCIADCFLVIFRRFLCAKKFYTPSGDEKWDVRESFKHPFYAIFKQLYTSDDTAIIFSILEAMYAKCQIVGYLLLFYVISSKIQDETNIEKDEYVLAYQEFCKTNDRDVAVELADDLEACALDDFPLYRHLIPLVLGTFGKEAVGSEPLIRVICSHCESSVALDFMSQICCENITFFRRDTFTNIVIASLEWDDWMQIFFWDLVKSEGVPFDWIVPILPKLSYDKHPRAAVHALVMMRTYAEANMAMTKQLISREKDDKFALNALKVLVQDDTDCQKLTSNINTLIRKALETNDLYENGKKSKQSPPKKSISLQLILGHLDMLRKYCLAKPTGQTEKALKEFVDVFGEIKANSSCADLCREYGELFAAIEILTGPGGRNLRKNRQRNNFEMDVSSLYEKDKSPPKRRRIRDDSDED